MGFMNPVVGLLTVLRERIVRSVVCSHLDHMFCPDGLELSLFVIRYTHM